MRHPTHSDGKAARTGLPRLDKRSLTALTAIYLLLIGWVAAAWLRSGGTSAAGAGLVETCPLRLLFGLTCPCCGLTRASVLLLHGQTAAAWTMNPLCYVVALLTVAYPLMLACDLILHRRTIPAALRLARSRCGILLIAAMLIAAWLLAHP